MLCNSVIYNSLGWFFGFCILENTIFGDFCILENTGMSFAFRQRKKICSVIL